jgi:2-keto-4-pentenoate hydratase
LPVDGITITNSRGSAIRKSCCTVAGLATQRASRCAGLKAGQIVMTGSVMKTVFPLEDATYRFDFAPIGFVEVRIREQPSAG